jgi:hypothetical protein
LRWRLEQNLATPQCLAPDLRHFALQYAFTSFECSVLVAITVAHSLSAGFLPPAAYRPRLFLLYRFLQNPLGRESTQEPHEFFATLPFRLPLYYGAERLGLVFPRCYLLFHSGVLLLRVRGNRSRNHDYLSQK